MQAYSGDYVDIQRRRVPEQLPLRLLVLVQGNRRGIKRRITGLKLLATASQTV